MLVLALEFSRGAPARDASPSATDQRDGRARGERPSERRLETVSPKEQDPTGRSLKTEEREARRPPLRRHDDGRALSRQAPMRSSGRSLAGGEAVRHPSPGGDDTE